MIQKLLLNIHMIQMIFIKILNNKIQINLSHYSDIDFKDFMKRLYKNVLQNHILFSLTSNNSLRFRKKLVEGIQKLIMAINDKIRDEKLQYHINREVAKILALKSRKIDKYEYLTSEEIL